MNLIHLWKFFDTVGRGHECALLFRRPLNCNFLDYIDRVCKFISERGEHVLLNVVYILVAEIIDLEQLFRLSNAAVWVVSLLKVPWSTLLVPMSALLYSVGTARITHVLSFNFSFKRFTAGGR